MNLTRQVAWEVLPGEDSEESLDGFHVIGSSTVGYSDYSGYVFSGYSFSGCYLTVESLMRCEPSHTNIYMPWLF